MSLPAAVGISRERIRRYASEIGGVAFVAGWGFGRLSEGGGDSPARFYGLCALSIGFLVWGGHRLRQGITPRDYPRA